MADEYEEMSVWGDVNAVGYTLEKVLAEWSVVIEKIENFEMQLDRNETMETTCGVRSASGDIYAECKSFIGPLFSKYRAKQQDSYSEYTEYDARRSRHLRVTDDQVARFRMKVIHHFIRLSGFFAWVLKFTSMHFAELSFEI